MIEDCDLIFDKTLQRYTLSEQYVHNFLGEDIRKLAFDDYDTNPETFVKRFINIATRSVYDYIDLHALDAASARYLVAVDQTAHYKFKECLEMAVYDLISKGVRDGDDGTLLAKNISSKLQAIGILHVIIRNIPKDVEEW